MRTLKPVRSESIGIQDAMQKPLVKMKTLVFTCVTWLCKLIQSFKNNY